MEPSPTVTSDPPSARGPRHASPGHQAGAARGPFAVSVVMTTHGDAAATDITLASLCEQSIRGWELVVQTAGSAETEGTHPWILFVDAGDTLQRGMLARVRETLAADPSLDAIHCGWTLVGDEDAALVEERCDAEGDLFDLLACRPAFPSCACVVRRTVVEAAGGFDPTMGVAADWVLWQRIARRGAKFGRVPEALVSRRARADRGASPADEAAAALRAIALGHRADPSAAVSSRTPYAAGRLASADAAEVNALCAAAGRELATGGDAAALVELLAPGRRALDADAAATELVRAAPLSLGQPLDWWSTHWESLREPIAEFLTALERRVERSGVVRAVTARVQRLVLPHLSAPLPAAADGTRLDVLQVAGPIDDIRVDAAVETVQLLVQLESQVLGAIELPPIEGRVSAHAIRAVVAEQWTERVLARYLARHPEARTLPVALWAPDHPLVALLSDVVDRFGAFVRGADDGRHRGPARVLVVEAGSPVPAFTVGRRNVAAELRVAGRKVGSTEIVPGTLGIVSGRAIRTALCEASASALARVVVRDLVLGAPLAGGLPLHERAGARLAQSSPPARARD